MSIVEEQRQLPMVLMSIQKQWNDLIRSDQKVGELRKTLPFADRYKNSPEPFKFRAFIYETQSSGGLGSVIGEFIVPQIRYLTGVETFRSKSAIPLDEMNFALTGLRDGFVSYEQQDKYYNGKSRRYILEIQNPVFYKTPIPLQEFGVLSAPQSWCYVEE